MIADKFLDHSMVSDDGTRTFAEDNLNKSRDKLAVLKSERTYNERFKKSPLSLIEGKNHEMIGAVAAEHEATHPRN